METTPGVSRAQAARRGAFAGPKALTSGVQTLFERTICIEDDFRLAPRAVPASISSLLTSGSSVLNRASALLALLSHGPGDKSVLAARSVQRCSQFKPPAQRHNRRF